MDSSKLFILLGALLAFLAVSAGAFGSHLLKSKLTLQAQATYEIAVRYQMYHALALLFIGLLMHMFPQSIFMVAGALFILGSLIFSGSLYILALTGTGFWGAITPIGGLLLLAGWLTVMIGVLSGGIWKG